MASLDIVNTAFEVFVEVSRASYLALQEDLNRSFYHHMVALLDAFASNDGLGRRHTVMSNRWAVLFASHWHKDYRSKLATLIENLLSGTIL